LKSLGIIGAGELGQQIANFAIQDGHYSNVFFFDDFADTSEVKGIKVLGKVKDIQSSFNQNTIHEIVIGVGYKHITKRKELYDFWSNSIPFGKIIHSSCIIDKSSIIKAGSILYPNTVIDKNVVIEENVLLNLSCTIAHDAIVGKHSFLGPSVTIAGFTHVGECCFLGVSTTVIDNIKIGNNISTGAGSVVTKNIIEKGRYIGCPAKLHRI
jgi:sugar O-acyltransferase (sialic acid O-acetyltransferase NeuD family)